MQLWWPMLHSIWKLCSVRSWNYANLICGCTVPTSWLLNRWKCTVILFTHTHTYKHACRYTCMHSHTQVHMHTHTHTLTHIHTHTHKYTHTYTYTHTHSHTHTCTQTYHKHTDCMFSCCLPNKWIKEVEKQHQLHVTNAPKLQLHMHYSKWRSFSWVNDNSGCTWGILGSIHLKSSSCFKWNDHHQIMYVLSSMAQLFKVFFKP